MFCPRCHRQYPADHRFCPTDGERTAERPDLTRVRASPTRLTDALLGERYKIRGFIGRGAMARVYLAQDEQSGRPVAVKVLSEPYANEPNARERFVSEARTVNLIGHPNIVTMLEAGERESDGAPYLVMEFLFGETLGRYLERERTLPTEIALPALRQAASALAAAHQKGVVHRDVKPDNLYLLGEPGDPHELKVLDFGFSKLQTSALTAAGVVLGTPGYMAPEQVLAEKVDERTDIYALGMVMYRALCGALPFSAEDKVSMLAHQVHTPARRPTSVRAGLDPRIEAVIRTATRKAPRSRYPSMDVFFDDLGKLADPKTKLWAFDVTEDRYLPSTTIGEMVADSLRRVLEEA